MANAGNICINNLPAISQNIVEENSRHYQMDSSFLDSVPDNFDGVLQVRVLAQDVEIPCLPDLTGLSILIH